MRMVVLFCALLSATVMAEESITIGDFSLKDFRGKTVALSDYQDRQLVVVTFLGTECPLAKLYGKRIAELQRAYDDSHPGQVAMLGIMANRQDSVTEIAAYARIHELSFPLLKDLNQQVAGMLAASRTPQTFLLGPVDQDGQRAVIYQGRIDDQYGIGYAHDQPDRQDLVTAIDESLNGESVSQPWTEPVGCIIGRRRTIRSDAAVTYAGSVAHILQRRCVECHREGQIAPFALTDYEEVAGWAEMMAEVVRQERMPPWHADPAHGQFANDRRMSDEEKQTIYEWVSAGSPRGDPADLPKPRRFVDGWALPTEPDAVIYSHETPHQVPAEGVIKYQYTIAPTNFEEDKWVTAAEIVPGSRAVVHHVLAFVRRPGQQRGDFSGARGGFLAAFVPGLAAEPLPDGMAKLVPAGSEIVFQIHYTPIGSPQEDRTKLGLVFGAEEDVTHLVRTVSAIETNLHIPPHQSDYQVDATSTAQRNDVVLLGLMPHMHLRGKSFTYTAQFPDGTDEVLLDVPRFDFNWQTSYRLAKPRTLPRGTRIHAVAHFDNSQANLANPDPTVAVQWGEQTWDEMMIGYFDIAIPIQDAGHLLRPDKDPIYVRRARKLMEVYDHDVDNMITKDEAPKMLRKSFDQIDTDVDGKISSEELMEALKKLH